MAGEADAADPTELAGVAEMHTESVEAWSLDDAAEDYPATGSWADPERRWTPRRVTILAVVASVAVLGTAAGVVVWQLRTERPVSTTHVVVATATVTTVVPEPPKPTPAPTVRAAAPSAVQKVPPPPPQPLRLTELDYLFMQKVRADGFTGSTDDLIHDAAKICYDLQHGKDLPEISQDMAAHRNVTPDQAHLFASEVFLTYPTCHA